MATKDKLLASAQKFLSKGQTAKAIGEYQKLVALTPKDVRHRQKLAELLSKEKRNEEALTEYEAVAKHYTETGFYLKAIAVFKQMQKIEPSRVDIYHRLAELNEKQGLIGNALTEYRNLVSFYDKNEMHHEAIEVLEKMAELDPENLNVTAKIAECYKAAGLTDEALEKFLDIVKPLSNKGEHNKVVKLYERFLEICPEEGLSRLPLAVALLNTGSAEKSIHILKGMLKNSPESLEIQKVLTDAYVANKDFGNARLTLKHLLKQTDKDLDLREYYVRICIDAGENERARDRLEDWKNDFFQGDRVVILQGFYEELKDILVGDQVVMETLNDIYEAVGETNKIDTSVAADVKDDVSVETADDALLDDAIDDVETLEMVGEDVADDIDVPSLGGEDAKPVSDEKKAVGLELDLDLELEVPVAQEQEPEAVAAPVEPEAEDEPEESAAVAEQAEEIEVEVDIDLDDMGDLDIEFEDEVAEVSQEPEFAAETEDFEVETEDFELETEDFELESEEVADETEELGVEPEEVANEAEEFEVEAEQDAAVSESDEVEPEEDEFEAELSLDDELELGLEDVEAAEAEAEFDLDVDVEDAPTLATDDFELEDALDDLDEPAFAESSEEILEAEADESLEPVFEAEEPEALQDVEIEDELEVLDELPEVEELEEVQEVEELEVLDELEELEELEELDELEEVEELEEAEPVLAASKESALDFASALNVEAELEEAEFYLQQGLYDDAARVVQTLLEYRPDLPLLHDKMAEINQSRQAAEQETAADDFVDILGDIQDDDLLAATDFLDSFGADDVDDELAQKTVSELDSADTESHYNLGIAYKEMGLYDDAIAEFEKSAQDPARAVDSITLIGQCRMEAGETDAALEAFKQGLASDNLTAESRMTLNFELGMLYQMNGQLLEALEAFQLVAEQDSFFRDVSELIKNLRHELGLDDSDDDDGPQGNRDRVSYV